MEILGIGPLELLFILLIALIVIGPKDMLKTGRNLGKTLRKVVTSPQWQTVTRTSREIRNIPNRLIREAGLEEVQQELNGLKKTTADIQNTLRESTILPAGWAGLNKPVEASTNTKQPNPILEQSIDPAIIIPSPDTESFAPPSSVATTDLDVLQPKGSTHPSTDLAAWILSPDEYDSAVDKENRDSGDNISAWITPPRSSRQKTTKKPKT